MISRDSVIQTKWARKSAAVPLTTRIGTERGGFEPPKPVSQFNGLANRKQSAANTKPKRNLRQIDDDLPIELPTDTCHFDPDLVEIMGAWADLPKATRSIILTLVSAGANGGEFA
jgi:hypothetical protein